VKLVLAIIWICVLYYLLLCLQERDCTVAEPTARFGELC
jgi:hypothetical protein